MALTSLKFLLFVFAAVLGYYVIPRRFQWMWLLLFSYVYYLAGGYKIGFFLIFTTLTTYGCALGMEYIAGKASGKKEARKKKRWLVFTGMLLNFGMLAVLKYTNFAIINVNRLFGCDFRAVDFLLPLGISFYTFQSMGYLMDVYWEKVKAERNPFRFALFVSFFPQILQGPIGRYSRLACQLFEPHAFGLQQITRSLELILWGFFKKMVLADNAAVFADAIFGEPEKYSGLAIAGVLAYSIQLYGDFSGGMDVVQGIAGLFGITLDENFRRPYFAVSVTDFWHRWHITLGTWMKDYVFYPVSLSGFMGKFGKSARKKFGKTLGRALPICIANIIVFLLVGIWHGAAWKFIAYGLYNGLIIGVSGIMAPNYRKWKSALHIKNDSRGFYVFQVLRTFVLVNISWFFDRADTVRDAVYMMRQAVTTFDWSPLLTIPATVGGSQYNGFILTALIMGTLILFAVSFLQEKGVSVRTSLEAKPAALRLCLYLLLLFAIPIFGNPPMTSGGFIYANF